MPRPKVAAKRKARKVEQGPLAQLVERFHGMEEVSGSIPLGSTKNKTAKTAVLFFKQKFSGKMYAYAHESRT